MTGRMKRFGPMEFMVGLIILILFAGLLWVLTNGRQQALRTAPSGFDGLQVWLSSSGASAQRFTGGWMLDPEAIGLMVVPLFDTELDVRRERPSTTEELIFQKDEYDLWSSDLREKVERVPTLVILPKWRTGLRLTGIAHPELLVPLKETATTLRKLTGLRDLRLVGSRVPFTEFTYATQDGDRFRAEIYAAQALDAPGCSAIIGRPGAMILAECPLARNGQDQERVFVLADPDLFNNHGLRLGDNAFIARDFVMAQAKEANVVLDYSRDVWLQSRFEGVQRERTWSDLKRFFDPPFLALWLGASLLLALFVWRSSVRGGPLLDEMKGGGASRELAILARARLMRLSGQDGALLRDYTAARLAATAANLFGPAHAGHYADETAFLRYAERRHPTLAERLKDILQAIQHSPKRISGADAIAKVDELERILEHMTNDA